MHRHKIDIKAFNVFVKKAKKYIPLILVESGNIVWRVCVVMV